MKTNAFAPLVVLALACTGHPVYAQISPGLAIKTYAGLSVTGEVGRVYQVQYATELSETNTWYALQHFELKWNPHEFVDTTSPVTERRFYRAVAVEVPVDVVPVANMVFIPSGTFLMGSPTNEYVGYGEFPQTEVTISRGFWMGAYEVTQEEYQEVVENNPSYWRNGMIPTCPYGFCDQGGSGGPVTNELAHPVEQVSWFDATNFCALLTERERAAGRLPTGYVYRLPTEAEWEYGCRAGTKTAFGYGAALRSGMANFDGRGEYAPCSDYVGLCFNPDGIWLGRTAEVGTYLPNAWGLYDMHGNVFEWCRDWSADSLPGGSVTDPTGPEAGWERVKRGGDYYDVDIWGVDIWSVNAFGCRSAARSRLGPAGSLNNLGFRVVLVSVP